MEKGVEQGRHEERVAIIKQLMSSGMTIDQVAVALNMGIEELKKLL